MSYLPGYVGMIACCVLDDGAVDAISREPTGNAQFLWTVVILACRSSAPVYWFVRRPMQPHAGLRASRMY